MAPQAPGWREHFASPLLGRHGGSLACAENKRTPSQARTSLRQPAVRAQRRNTPTESTTTTTTNSIPCLSSSPNNTSGSAPVVSSPEPSNDDLNPIRCSPNRARLPARSSESTVTRKSSSKCHSSLTPCNAPHCSRISRFGTRPHADGGSRRRESASRSASTRRARYIRSCRVR